MRFDTNDVESKQILREMKEIKKLCSEAYNATDDAELKEHIQLMYEGKIWEKVKLLAQKVLMRMNLIGQSIQNIEDKVRQFYLKLPTKAVVVLLKKHDLRIENYQEFDNKGFIKIWYSLKELEYFAKMKAGEHIAMDDPAIVKILETAKNLSALKKEWDDKLMTPPRTAKYSDVGLKQAKELIKRYAQVINLLDKRLKKMAGKADELTKKEGTPETIRVANAVASIIKALVGCVEEAIAKDASIQKRIWNALGQESITL